MHWHLIIFPFKITRKWTRCFEERSMRQLPYEPRKERILDVEGGAGSQCFAPIVAGESNCRPGMITKTGNGIAQLNTGIPGRF